MTKELGPAVTAATAFRSAGIRCQIYAENRKFKAKMSYADKLGVPFAVLLGEDEIAEGVCSVKNMQTGEQIKCAPAQAAEHIKDAISAAAGPLILEK